jgi:hypothetical protein
MSFLTLNGAPALSAVVTMPLIGAWTAEVTVDAREAPSGAARLEAADGKAVWVGTVYRAGMSNDSAMVRIVGGAGGLAEEVEPKFYRDVDAGQVAREALEAVGERLSGDSDSSVVGTKLSAWARMRGPAGEALRALTGSLGAHWRVLADGSVWVGRESWPASRAAPQTLEQAPQAGMLEVWSEVPDLEPGQTLDGKRLTKVEHRIGEEIRTLAWTDDEGLPGDDLMDAIEATVRHLTSGVDYLALYLARVVKQNDDGSLELEPDDRRIPGLSKVPIAYGIPGLTAKVASGSRVALAFASGNPAAPVATVWESSSLQEIKITAAQKVEVAVEASGTASIAVGAGGTATIEAGAAGTVSLKVGVGGSVKLGGDGAAMAVAMQGDTAGPYPLICKGMVVKAKLV